MGIRAVPFPEVLVLSSPSVSHDSLHEMLNEKGAITARSGSAAVAEVISGLFVQQRCERSGGGGRSTRAYSRSGLRAKCEQLGVRQVRIYLPRGLRGRIVMSYLLRVCDRSRRASICFISAFVTGASLWYGVLI